MTINKRLLEPVDEYSWAGNTAESIVLHITAGGNYSGAEETLKIRHLSYHFIIDKDGTINQLVDLGRSAWHAGIKSNPVQRVVKFFGKDNPNRRSIGISFVCTQDFLYVQDLTEAQIDAGIWLIKFIGQQTGVRYTADNIFSHGEITDYKEHMVADMKALVSELVGYRDEKDVATKVSQLQQIIELLKRLIVLKNGKKNN